MATFAQVAQATEATATLPAMESGPESDFRKERLAALAEHPDFGSKLALGKALGYRDGAMVGQMLRGERPITEKTLTKIASIRGGKFRGWFSRSGYEVPPFDWPFERIAPVAWAKLSERARGAVEAAAVAALRDLDAAVALAPARPREADWRQLALEVARLGPTARTTVGAFVLLLIKLVDEHTPLHEVGKNKEVQQLLGRQ